MVKTAAAIDEPDFETWSTNQPPEGHRLGQHLFNTAPKHISGFACGVTELDPFYADSIENLYILNNFLLFANLVWDVVDEDEIREAFHLVMSEPNARRR